MAQRFKSLAIILGRKTSVQRSRVQRVSQFTEPGTLQPDRLLEEAGARLSHVAHQGAQWLMRTHWFPALRGFSSLIGSSKAKFHMVPGLIALRATRSHGSDATAERSFSRDWAISFFSRQSYQQHVLECHGPHQAQVLDATGASWPSFPQSSFSTLNT